MHSPREAYGASQALSARSEHSEHFSAQSSSSGGIAKLMLNRMIEQIKKEKLKISEGDSVKAKLLSGSKSREFLVQQSEQRCAQKISAAKQNKEHNLATIQRRIKILSKFKVNLRLNKITVFIGTHRVQSANLTQFCQSSKQYLCTPRGESS